MAIRTVRMIPALFVLIHAGPVGAAVSVMTDGCATVAVVVAVLSAERLESAAAITDQLVEDVLLNVGYRIQVDRKGLVFYIFPSKKMLLLLGAAFASAEKVYRAIQIFLS